MKVAKRAGASTHEARGIFPGAKVERGPAWEWGNQDGKYVLLNMCRGPHTHVT